MMRSKIQSTFRDLKQSMRDNPALWRSRGLFLLGVAVSFFVVEILNENDPIPFFGDLEPWQTMWNLFWYGFLFLVCWLITGTRRRPAAFLGSGLSFLFGLANHYVLRFRGKTLFPVDILSWRTAANVAGNYDYAPDKYIWGALALLALYWLLLLLRAGSERGHARAPRRWRLGTAGLCAGFLLLFFCTPMLEICNIYACQWKTQGNGFLFNFMVSLSYSFLEEPDGYCEEAVEEIVYETLSEREETALQEADMPVNVIAIMNESFADFSLYENFSVSQDPLEFFHSLRENTIRGWLYSPVIGGGTANCEYEFLTGNSTAFLPEGTVAYQLYLDDATPSLASVFGDLGYDTWAFHPYLSSGWNRVQAYERLGFAHQLYQEDVTDPEYVRSYISDACGYRQVEAITESAREIGSRSFIFNVTMQNHSGYIQGWNNLTHSVALAGALEGLSAPAEQYVSLLDASDAALEQLIGYYSAVEEPTLIIFFGDHQPPLPDEFYEALYGKDLDDRTDEEILTEYMTPFFIWANYDIPERSDVVVSMNYLGVLAAQAAHIPMNGYLELVADTMEELPVIHEIGYYTETEEGLLTEEELDEEEQELLEDYEYMAYFSLFDEDAALEEAFFTPGYEGNIPDPDDTKE